VGGLAIAQAVWPQDSASMADDRMDRLPRDSIHTMFEQVRLEALFPVRQTRKLGSIGNLPETARSMVHSLAAAPARLNSDETSGRSGGDRSSA
jgi:hypothetical protein